MTRFVATALLLVTLVSTALAAEPSRAWLEEARQHALRGATGIVEGRAYMEGRRPSDPDDPLAGIGILIVPRSTDILEYLDAVKRRSRDSIEGFREAAPATRTALDDYELELWRMGYPDAAIRTATDASGAFRASVPPGAWIVFAERSVFVSIRSSRSEVAPSAIALDPLARYSTSQYQHFHKVARLTGFDAVSVWLREVDVRAGESVALDLHDRGVWLSGVFEETETPRRVRIVGRGRRR